MRREEFENELKVLLEDDSNILEKLITSFISYNGFFADDEIFSMEDMEEIMDCTNGINLLQRAYFGYDGDYTSKEGSHTEPFNPNSEYFYFNGYGNLVSTNYKDYSDLIGDAIRNIDSLPYDDLPTEIQDLFDQMEEA